MWETVQDPMLFLWSLQYASTTDKTWNNEGIYAQQSINFGKYSSQLKMENTICDKHIENKLFLGVIKLKHHICSQICLCS